MYKHIVDLEAIRSIDSSLAGLAKDAIELCQPTSFNILMRVDLEDLYLLSAKVSELFEAFTDHCVKNGLDRQEVGFLFGELEYTLPAISNAHLQWSDLPEPFSLSEEIEKQFQTKSPEMARVAMLLTACTLTLIDRAVGALLGNDATSVSVLLSRSARLIALATAWRNNSATFSPSNQSQGGPGNADFPQAGGLAKSALYEPTRSFVIDKFKARVWKSPRSAAAQICGDAYRFSLKTAMPLAETNAMQSCYNWIRAHIKNSGESSTTAN